MLFGLSDSWTACIVAGSGCRRRNIPSDRPLRLPHGCRKDVMTALDNQPASPASPPANSLDAEQVGYKQSLGRRHVQMIAIGGAIGTGLFLGSASRLHNN